MSSASITEAYQSFSLHYFLNKHIDHLQPQHTTPDFVESSEYAYILSYIMRNNI